jgi:hypothetical protein
MRASRSASAGFTVSVWSSISRRLELRDLRLLDDDLLLRLGLRERACLVRLRARGVRLRLHLRLRDLGVGDGLRRGGRSCLLLLRRRSIRLGGRNPGVALDCGLVRCGEVLDVAAGIVDLLDLQRVDLQAERLHLLGGRAARLRRHPGAVADDLLHRQATQDRAEVAREELVHRRRHRLLGLAEEAARRIRDLARRVPDLVDDDAANAHRHALARDALHRQVRLLGVQRELAHGLETGQDERALSDRDLVARSLRVPLARHDAADRAGAGDDERLVRLRHAPGELDQAGNEPDGDDEGYDDDDQDGDHWASLSSKGDTFTVRGPMRSMTTTSVPTSIVSASSQPCAWKVSEPPA